MTIEKQNRQVFCVQYIRQGKTNQWKARTTEEQGVKAIDTEGVMALVTTQWENKIEAKDDRPKIYATVERDPRYFDMSSELEEAQIAMLGKANQMADQDFLKRHPDAKIEHSEKI